ncbi:MAG: 3-hydroxyacyl-CoA dehydrogenase family protein [Bryobacteraceae bacterium]
MSHPGNGLRPERIPAGIVGAGLMGTSIAACLVSAGHPVVAVERDERKRRAAPGRLKELLRESRREGLLKGKTEAAAARYSIAGDTAALKSCRLVFEAIVEDVDAKRRVIRDVEDVVVRTALIGSNTSAIPITHLQSGARHPERVLGVHWGEPAHINRFMEIICGERTRPVYARRIGALARLWGKEHSILQRDIRGFITNRVMYAMIREACHIVESGVATVADVDRSLRNDLGYWLTFAGPFRFMDLTGIPAYAAVMRDLLPELSASTQVPAMMTRDDDQGGRLRGSRSFQRERVSSLHAGAGAAVGETFPPVHLRDPRSRDAISRRCGRSLYSTPYFRKTSRR